MSAATERKRLLYPDILRVMATMLVILNHLPSADLHLFHSFPLSAADLFFSYVIITDVPIFFMLTGVLLMDREESVREIHKKRIMRIALALFIVITGMYITNALVAVKHGEVPDLNLWGYFKILLSGGMDGAEFYWFLYAYISLLLMLPFMRPAAVLMGKSEFITLLGVRILIETVLPVANSLSDMLFNDTIGLSSHLSVPIAVFDAFFFSMSGYYLDRKIDVAALKAKHFFMFYAGCIAAMVVSYALPDGEHWRLFSWLYTFTLFLTVKRLAQGKVNDGFAKVIQFLSPLTFGIYLLDPFFKRAFYAKYTDLFGSVSTTIFFSLGWLVFSFTLGAFLTFCWLGVKKRLSGKK